MKDKQRIKEVLENTEILLEPDDLISTEHDTTLHYYVLSKPYYLDEFPEEGPETKVREGKITWEKPKLLTPDYMINMSGFSGEAKDAMQIIAQENPDLAGLLYKMNYKKQSISTFTIAREIEAAEAEIREDIDEDDSSLTVIIKGVDELWDVSLMKFIQTLMLKSAYKSQLPDYEEKGFLSTDDKGYSVVTRNLEGLPIAASEEIEKMFEMVKNGDEDPSKLKRELDRWGVFNAYQDRFFDLFRED
ncbi:hypothetical protein DFR79_10354 [Halanaerobium saccharolyticum]|uniref:Uncharacterized protein n=1 Tax=Halanaerobium saccharolyticum TaxID=43595 RepID=A0A4R6M0E0_9FIRM|nr:hypothetical protein [Halanaerobium saccharolyticum]TDO94376.1 hypothetical protein DFR79_10354 [Halanaerobium saccharolyticum]